MRKSSFFFTIFYIIIYLFYFLFFILKLFLVLLLYNDNYTQFYYLKYVFFFLVRRCILDSNLYIHKLVKIGQKKYQIYRLYVTIAS